MALSTKIKERQFWDGGCRRPVLSLFCNRLLRRYCFLLSILGRFLFYVHFMQMLLLFYDDNCTLQGKSQK